MRAALIASLTLAVVFASIAATVDRGLLASCSTREPQPLSEEDRAQVVHSIRLFNAILQDFYASALTADNWTPALPRTDSRPPAALQVYLKRDRLCCVMADKATDSGRTSITLLHKQLRLE